MIRLAVSGIEGPELRMLASRLRGGVVDPPGDRDAAVVLDLSADSATVTGMFLRSGKSALVSTASCPSLESLDQFAEHCRRGGRLAIMNPSRFLPTVRAIKQQIEAGKLGAVGLVRIHHWESDERASRSAVLCGCLDLAVWLAGVQPACLYAVAGANPAYTQVHLGFAGGAAALIDVCVPSRSPAPTTGTVRHDYRSFSVIGSTGAAYADDQMREMEDHLSRAAMVQQFVDGLQADEDFSQAVRGWRQVLEVASAIERSLATRGVVNLEGG